MMMDEMVEFDEENLWTPIQAAEFLGVKRSTIYTARRQQGLPAVQVMGSLRFRPSSVRAWAISMETTDGGKVKEGRPSVVGPNEPVRLI